MRFIVIFIMGISLIAETTHDIDSSNMIKRFEYVEVTHCDKFGWCKVKNKELYIRGFLFSKHNNHYILTKTDHTHFFSKMEKGNFFNTYNKALIDSKSAPIKKTHIEYENEKKIKPTYIKNKTKTQAVGMKEKFNENDKRNRQDLNNDSYDHKYDYFISGYFGSSFIGIEGNSIATSQALDKNGFNYDVGLGYYLIDNIFFTANAAKTVFSSTDIISLYLSANYQFDSLFRPYVGVLFGHETTYWKRNPTNFADNEIIDFSFKDTSLSYGLQAGLLHNITNRILLFFQYQLINRDNEFKIFTNSTNNTRIEYGLQNNVGIGVRYSFN